MIGVHLSGHTQLGKPKFVRTWKKVKSLFQAYNVSITEMIFYRWNTQLMRPALTVKTSAYKCTSR